MSTGVRWNKADDKKQIELFRTPHNGVDPEKLDTDSVKAVLEKYWPQKKYVNFGPLYWTKARNWCVSRSLDGNRKSRFQIEQE
jgi:hypothetical protein